MNNLLVQSVSKEGDCECDDGKDASDVADHSERYVIWNSASRLQ